MGLKRALGRAARVLIKRPTTWQRCTVSRALNSEYLVTVSAYFPGQDWPVSGTGQDARWSRALGKALGEFAERHSRIDAEDTELGAFATAAGLVGSGARERARCELIERHCFRRFFEGVWPSFSLPDDGPPHVSFLRLASVDPERAVVLAFNRSYLSEDTCLILGMGCDRLESEARLKAFREFQKQELVHQDESVSCAVAGSMHPLRQDSSPVEVVDFHHRTSTFEAERKHLRWLLGRREKAGSHLVTLTDESWVFSERPSVVRFMKVFEARHPSLENLVFGRPMEVVTDGGVRALLYHPFW